VLLTTGAPPPQGTYTDATTGFDVDSIGLTNMAVRLNQGLDIAGQPIGSPTRFLIGVGVNPLAPIPDVEWRRLAHKVEAGAEFIMTPPVLDLAAFEGVLPRLLETKLPVIAGVVALESLRQAEFLASEILGVRVAGAIVDRLRGAADEAEAALVISLEIVRWLRTRVHGVQITTLHGSPESALRLLTALHRERIV
jgi:homocysteine S-methyltransferase